MKKSGILSIGLLLVVSSVVLGAGKEMEIKGEKLISEKPPFKMILPSGLKWIHSSSVENPAESSLTRIGIYMKEIKKQVEEMLIVQIADKTNPQAGPMIVPPLKPYTEKRIYSGGKIKRKEVEIDYLIQLMAWNPEAPSLQFLIKKGVTLPSHWALQGQILFVFQAEHAVLLRYSRDVNSFGLKVSDRGDDWNKETISGNEKKAYEIFQKFFMGMMDSIQIRD